MGDKVEPAFLHLAVSLRAQRAGFPALRLEPISQPRCRVQRSETPQLSLFGTIAPKLTRDSSPATAGSEWHHV